MSAKKKVNKSPTSFLLEEELLTRFRVACAGRKTTQSEVVAMAIERWLGEIPNEEGEGTVNSGTKSADRSNPVETFNEEGALNRRILSKDSEASTPGPTEIKSGERSITEVSPQYTDSTGVAAAVESFKADLRDLRAHLARIEQHLTGGEKATKSANRSKRLGAQRKRKHPGGAQSGA